jgi:NAD(P)H-dependent flavin oxidoreductase YrpB (nitropropane dioxygenase family)
MTLPSLKIRSLESELPIIQAGMGVRVGNACLAAAAVNAGGYGVIASVGLGDDTSREKRDFARESNRFLVEEVRAARRLCGNKKPVGVNIMVALSNYEEIARASVGEKVDFIISGAGLPLNLPQYVGDADIALIPVISSGRALAIILKAWKRKYNRAPDAVIVEGPRCGGHLGFSREELDRMETRSLEILYAETSAVLKEYNLNIPLIGAGEVASRDDIRHMLKLGFAGVQIGTRILATEEAGMDRASKMVYVSSRNSDVTVINSPVGLPVRVLKTALVERVLAGKRDQFTCPWRCLRTCNPATAPFCIAKALMATWSGDIDNGLFMVGCNVDALDKITTVKEFFDSLR